jgi:hypothetical protein
MVIPVLDAGHHRQDHHHRRLLTQRKLADYLLANTTPTTSSPSKTTSRLLADIRLIFEGRAQPDFREPLTLAHGRIEQRAIWTTTRLNDYLNFPGVGQAFVIERHTVEKKTGKTFDRDRLRPHRPHPGRADAAKPSWPAIAVTGPSRTAVTTSWTGTGTRTAAPSARATAPPTSPRYAASPSAPSRQSPATPSPPPSSAWRATSVWCSTTWA